MGIKRVDAVSKDAKAELLVFTEDVHGNHVWIFSEPDENSLRVIQFNAKTEGKGILLGSVIPIAGGYITQSPELEIGRSLGVKFPDRPESKRIWISLPIIAIMIKEIGDFSD